VLAASAVAVGAGIILVQFMKADWNEYAQLGPGHVVLAVAAVVIPLER
jgi:hypothetical protein